MLSVVLIFKILTKLCCFKRDNVTIFDRTKNDDNSQQLRQKLINYFSYHLHIYIYIYISAPKFCHSDVTQKC